MQKKSSLFVGVLLALSSTAIAKDVNVPSGIIHLPDATQLIVDTAQSKDGAFVLEGEATVKGKLLLYWADGFEGPDSDKPKKAFGVYFYPDKTEAKTTLPTFSSGTQKSASAPLFISVGNKITDEQAKTIVSGFKGVPENFLKYRFGKILVSATVRLGNLNAAYECDSFSFSGVAVAIKDKNAVLHEPLDAYLQDTGCVSVSDITGYTVSARKGKSFEIKAAPDAQSKTLATLANGTLIDDIKTINSNWYQVTADNGKGKNITGHIYVPALKFEDPE